MVMVTATIITLYIQFGQEITKNLVYNNANHHFSNYSKTEINPNTSIIVSIPTTEISTINISDESPLSITGLNPLNPSDKSLQVISRSLNNIIQNDHTFVKPSVSNNTVLPLKIRGNLTTTNL